MISRTEIKRRHEKKSKILYIEFAGRKVIPVKITKIDKLRLVCDCIELSREIMLVERFIYEHERDKRYEVLNRLLLNRDKKNVQSFADEN